MFDLIDSYVGTRLGADLLTLSPHETTIVESKRRLTREISYGYVHALWWMRLQDGRSVISIPPGSKNGVTRALRDIGDHIRPFSRETGLALKERLDAAAIEGIGLGQIDRVLIDIVFACDSQSLRSHPLSTCARLSDPAVPLADGIHVPRRCVEDGVAFGVIDEGVLVSVAYAHRSGFLQDRVADVGVETTTTHQRRGLAKSAVSALVADFAARGGQARYGCSPDNAASIATAKSVGFASYAESLILTAKQNEAG